jgi:hypothetical protein
MFTVAVVKHFTGYSDPGAPWQNACWVFDMTAHSESDLRDSLAKIAKGFNQESIALVLGTSELIQAASNGR